MPAIPNPFLPGTPLYQVYVVYTPRNAVSGYVDVSVPSGISTSKVRLHLDANYADSQYSFQSEPVKTDSSFIVNGRLALADIPMGMARSKMTVAVWARNLFDEAHIYRRSAANAATLGEYGNFNAPRTFGVEASISF